MVTNPEDDWDEGVVCVWHPHDARSSHAGIIPAGTRPHRRITSRRPFLGLSLGTPLCRCPQTDSLPVEPPAWSPMDPGRGYQGLLRSRIVIPLLETDLLDLPR